MSKLHHAEPRGVCKECGRGERWVVVDERGEKIDGNHPTKDAAEAIASLLDDAYARGALDLQLALRETGAIALGERREGNVEPRLVVVRPGAEPSTS